MINNEEVFIYGDGETSRDFCYIDNTVQANILAATAPDSAKDEVYNVALGDRTTLNQLYQGIQTNLKELGHIVNSKPGYRDFRAGDVRHSQADISKIKTYLGYKPTHLFEAGLERTVKYFVNL